MNIIQGHVLGRNGPETIIPTAGKGKPFPKTWTQSIPGEDLTSPQHIYEASKRLVAAGLSVIPIDAYEGSKSPDNLRLPYPHDPVNGQPRPSWSIYQIRRPTSEELDRWLNVQGQYGLAVLGGTVSGGEFGLGLEVIDFDTAEFAGPWKDAVGEEAPGLVQRLVRVNTPRPGLHVYYRCSRYGSNQKLAFAQALNDFGQKAVDASGRPIRKTLIELKGEGGYCLIPPSSARCHPTNRLYQYADGSPDLTNVPIITPDEREILLKAARALNQVQEPVPVIRPSKTNRKAPNHLLPGDDFNARAKWADILTQHGWTLVSAYGEEGRWCRPGKDGGISATTNNNGSDLLHVFSSNAEPFDMDGSYSKFTAYTMLNHEGVFTEAARDLREQGYGAKTLKGGKR